MPTEQDDREPWSPLAPPFRPADGEPHVPGPRPPASIAEVEDRDLPFAAMATLTATGGLLRRWLDRQAEADWQMSAPRVMVIMHLAGAGSLTMSELASGLDVTPRAITRLVDGLEADGYVERRRDADDRRVVHVSCSSATRARVAEMLRRHLGRVDELLSGTPPQDLRAALMLLEGVSHRLRAWLADDAGPDAQP